jgi:hypothetical protein
MSDRGGRFHNPQEVVVGRWSITVIDFEGDTYVFNFSGGDGVQQSVKEARR